MRRYAKRRQTILYVSLAGANKDQSSAEMMIF